MKAEPRTGAGPQLSQEKTARCGEIDIVYQTIGDPADPPLLLIMGLGSQMILWPDELCRMLAERGFYVIRFDNRDVGRSTKLDLAGLPSVTEAMAGTLRGAPYLLADMADDATGLLDALGIDAAHVVGASLGGMIAQTLALRNQDRVLSLASLMSTTGNGAVGQPHPEVIPVLMTPLPAERAGYIEFFMRARNAIGSPDFDEAMMRDVAKRSFERGYFPDGTLRQFVAILASGDRTAELRNLRLPTVVIHGEQDPLIDVSGGKATAEAIPDAELILIPGMGHDLPAGAWPRIVEAVVANVERSREED